MVLSNHNLECEASPWVQNMSKKKVKICQENLKSEKFGRKKNFPLEVFFQELFGSLKFFDLQCLSKHDLVPKMWATILLEG